MTDYNDDDPDFEPPPNPFLDAVFAAEDAVARHYAKQQEGLPPPVPSTAHLWQPHRIWLNTYYPVPRPPGGWMEPIPEFRWWYAHIWLPRTTGPVPPVPGGPGSPARPDPPPTA